MSLGDACCAEVHRLHRAIVDWTTGVVPDTDEAFASFAESFAPSFAIINPGGQMESAAVVVPRFRSRHGERASDFGIQITNEDVRLTMADRALVVYQEHWFNGAAERSVILSSALMERDPQRPGGVVWLHLHETWLKAPKD